MKVLRLSREEMSKFKGLRLRALRLAPDAFGSVFADEVDRPDAFWFGRAERAHASLLAVDSDGVDAGICTIAGAQEEGDVGLYSMWVEPDARGKGAGDALVREAIEVARELGAARIVLEVADANAPAIRLYERHGFVRTGNTNTMPSPREHITESEMALSLDRSD